MVASGGLAKRAGVKAKALSQLPDDHPVWAIAAHYLAHLCATLTLLVSPKVIVLGGGISHRSCMLPMIRKEFLAIINGYLTHELITEEKVDDFIIFTPFGADAGLIGAATLCDH